MTTAEISSYRGVSFQIIGKDRLIRLIETFLAGNKIPFFVEPQLQDCWRVVCKSSSRRIVKRLLDKYQDPIRARFHCGSVNMELDAGFWLNNLNEEDFLFLVESRWRGAGPYMSLLNHHRQFDDALDTFLNDKDIGDWGVEINSQEALDWIVKNRPGVLFKLSGRELLQLT